MGDPKERERKVGPKQTNLGELFTQFDRAGVRKKEDTANEIVRFATEGSSDWLTTLLAIGKGYAALAGTGSEPQGGRIILQGIDNYITRMGISTKNLIPGSEPINFENHTKINKIFDSINGSLKRAEKKVGKDAFPNVRAITWRVRDSIPGAIASERNVNFFVISHDFLSSPRRGEIISKAGARLDSFFDTSKKGIDNHIQTPQNILDWAKAQSDIEGLQHPYRGEVGGVTLEDIENEEDVEVFTKKALQFTNGIPRGDLFWNGFAIDLFMSSPLIINNQVGGKDTPSVSEFTEKVLMAQKIISEKFFSPSITGEADEEFDSLIKSILSTHPSRFAEHFIDMIWQSALLTSSNLNMIDDPLQEDPYLMLLSFDRRALDEFAARTGVRRFVADHVFVSSYFRSHKEEILENLRSRFSSDNKNWGIIQARLDVALALDLLSKRREGFVESVKKNVGEDFLNKLSGKTDDLDRLNQNIWKDIDKASYLPHSEATHMITFSDGSLPEIMGFNFVKFAYNPDGALEFYLSPRGSREILISGTIGEDGNIRLLYELGAENKGLAGLVKNIVMMSYHDLLIRNVASGEAKKARVKKTKERNGESTRPSRKAPRTQVIYESNPAEEEEAITIGSQELVEVANKEGEKKGFNPRPVDSFVTKLPGAYDYLRAVAPLLFTRDGLHSQGEAREKYLRKIAEARDAMYKPSQEKLDKLPKQFQLSYHDWSEVPDLEGRVYVENWVVEHPSPKLTPEEAASLAVHYQKRYRGGSSLAFLDYLKTWIIE